MMVKKLISAACIFGLAFVCTTQAFGFGSEALEPKVDVDLVTMQINQSLTVTADLASPFDLGFITVALIGSGNFSASLSRTNTIGEIGFILLQGFGEPSFDIKVGITPVTMRLSSTISTQVDVAYGVIVHGLAFSNEEPPYEYNINLSY